MTGTKDALFCFMVEIDTTMEMVSRIYRSMHEKLVLIRERLDRPLTVSEKILFSHTENPQGQKFSPGSAYLRLMVDRTILQDATAQMAVLQFMQSRRRSAAVPTTIHCDHLIRAEKGAAADLKTALDDNFEVYEFLRLAAKKYGMGFWGPGSGIIHQVALENYAFPGGLLIGADSHSPNLGGLGMLAIGVGGADVAEVMAGLAWELLQPKLIGVYLTGELSGWSAPKDVILHVAGKLTVSGGTNRIIEYFGPGAKTLSATGKATITNMGAEIGATSSIFNFDEKCDAYLRATGRASVADEANKNLALFTSDEEVEQNPSRFYDRILEINLSELEPHIVGPFSPDLARPVSQLKSDVLANGYPLAIAASLVGSCTNSSYEDLSRAAAVADQARAAGAMAVVPFYVNPGSKQVLETIKRDGQLGSLEAMGAQMMSNACGPCIGQWERKDIGKDEKNVIVNSYNRNFPGRNDSNQNTLAFVASPEVATAFALAGSLAINPLQEPLVANDGTVYLLRPPGKAPEFPAEGYLGTRIGYEAPSSDPDSIEILIPSGSERLQLLEPFGPIVEPELTGMPVLFKTKGKTTTDHISPAGPWLRFRGNLDRISDNLLSGAMNAWTGERGRTVNVFTGERGLPVAMVARDYKAREKRWVIVGDENYGEGSSREHAAMSPRWLGAAAVIAKSFARIHESNLKKQGILPLTFARSSDYEKIAEGDRVSLEYLHELDPVRSVNMLVAHTNGSSEIITLQHDLTMEHLAWFHAGSALNLVIKQNGAA